MRKHRIAQRELNEIGERWYDFDFRLQKNIYCYLCCIRLQKRDFRKLDLKFESYQQWKQYVRDKYDKYEKDMLNQFSRYLNQRIRNAKCSNQYGDIIRNVLLTLVFTKLFDTFLDSYLQMDFEGIPVIIGIVIILLLAFMLIAFIGVALYQTLKPVIDDNMDENFLKDYKEIIDEIIIEKKNNR